MSDKIKKAPEPDFAESLLDDFDKFEHFSLNYWRQIIAVAVLIVVVVAIIATVNSMQESKDKQIVKEFAKAKTEAEINAIIDKYPEHPSVFTARMRLINLYLGEKEYKKASEQYSVLATSKAPEFVKGLSRLRSAYLLEVEGKKEDAAKSFASLGMDALVPEGIRDEANYSAGRLNFALGNIEKAEELLLRVKQPLGEIPPSFMGMIPAQALWYVQAQSMLEDIQAAKAASSKG